MTPAELKDRVNGCGHEPHFFDRETMRFFGDTMRNYGVRDGGLVVRDCDGLAVECWVLYRKRPVKLGFQGNAYFSKSTFERVFPRYAPGAGP